MQSISTPARSRTFARIAGYAAATGAAWYALGGATDANSLTPLFGWQRLIVVQVVMTLPLGIFAALVLQKCVPVAWRRSLALAGSAAGLAATLLVAMIVPLIGRAAENGGLSWWLLVPMRAILCVAVELTWCVAIEAIVAPTSYDPLAATKKPSRATAWWGIVALGAAIALPAVYAEDLTRKQTAVASDLLARQQLVAAERVIARLCAIGSNRLLRGVDPTIVSRKLARTIAALSEKVDRANPAALDAEQTVELARALAMLDRVEAAQALLAPLAKTRADAALLLATTMQEQEQWQESRAQFAAAARMLRETPASHQRTAGLVQAIDGIAYNDRELGNFRAAQQSYEAGLQELPDAAAHFHYQLGRHHQLGGRPMTAVSHLQIAAALDPQGYGSQAAVLIRQLAAGSPGCLLGAPTVGSK